MSKEWIITEFKISDDGKSAEMRFKELNGVAKCVMHMSAEGWLSAMHATYKLSQFEKHLRNAFEELTGRVL